jgi:hypothetical protein
VPRPSNRIIGLHFGIQLAFAFHRRLPCVLPSDQLILVSLFICPLISLSVAAVSLDIWTLLSDFSSAGQCCLHYSVQSSGFTIVKLAMSILAGFIFVFLALPCQTLLSGALILTVGRNIGHCGCNFLMVNCLDLQAAAWPFNGRLVGLDVTWFGDRLHFRPLPCAFIEPFWPAVLLCPTNG